MSPSCAFITKKKTMPKGQKIPEQWRRGNDYRTDRERGRDANGRNPRKRRGKYMCKTNLCPSEGRRGWAKGFCKKCAKQRGHIEPKRKYPMCIAIGCPSRGQGNWCEGHCKKCAIKKKLKRVVKVKKRVRIGKKRVVKVKNKLKCQGYCKKCALENGKKKLVKVKKVDHIAKTETSTLAGIGGFADLHIDNVVGWTLSFADIATHRAKRKAESLAEESECKAASEAKARRAEARENHFDDEDYIDLLLQEEPEEKEQADDKKAGRKQTLITSHCQQKKASLSPFCDNKKEAEDFEKEADKAAGH